MAHKHEIEKKMYFLQNRNFKICKPTRAVLFFYFIKN